MKAYAVYDDSIDHAPLVAIVNEDDLERFKEHKMAEVEASSRSEAKPERWSAKRFEERREWSDNVRFGVNILMVQNGAQDMTIREHVFMCVPMEVWRPK